MGKFVTPESLSIGTSRKFIANEPLLNGDVNINRTYTFTKDTPSPEIIGGQNPEMWEFKQGFRTDYSTFGNIGPNYWWKNIRPVIEINAGNGYYTPLQSITGDRDFVPHVQVIQSKPHYMNFGYSEAYDSDYGNNPPRWEYSPQNGMNQLCLIDGTYVQGMWLRNWEYIRSFIVNKEFTFICILDDYYLHEGGFIVGFDRGHDIYSVYERDILEIFGTYGGQDNFYRSGFGAYGAAENAISIVRPKSGVMFMAITRDQGGQGWKTCRYNIGQYQASCTLNTVNFAEQFNASRIVFRPAGFRFFKFYLFDVHININELAANIHHFVSPS